MTHKRSRKQTPRYEIVRLAEVAIRSYWADDDVIHVHPKECRCGQCNSMRALEEAINGSR